MNFELEADAVVALRQLPWYEDFDPGLEVLHCNKPETGCKDAPRCFAIQHNGAIGLRAERGAPHPWVPCATFREAVGSPCAVLERHWKPLGDARAPCARLGKPVEALGCLWTAPRQALRQHREVSGVLSGVPGHLLAERAPNGFQVFPEAWDEIRDAALRELTMSVEGQAVWLGQGITHIRRCG